MTADDERLVTELAEALSPDCESCGDRDHILANLLPVVLADRRRAVAGALRAAADWHWGGSAEVDDVCDEIHARADAVEAGPSQPS